VSAAAIVSLVRRSKGRIFLARSRARALWSKDRLRIHTDEHSLLVNKGGGQRHKYHGLFRNGEPRS
jgi:hypothetical protein